LWRGKLWLDETVLCEAGMKQGFGYYLDFRRFSGTAALMNLQDFIDIYAYDGILHLASANCKETLAKVLVTPFDPNIHYTLAYIHLHYAMLDEAEAILNHTPDKTDETYKQLEDYLLALKECQRTNIGIFPLSVPYRNWWNGPHLPFPIEYNGNKLDSWFPVRLECVEKDKAYLIVAKLEDNKIVYAEVTIPDVAVEPDSMGEIAFYGDNYLIKFHKLDFWVQPAELNAVRLKAWPFIETSHKCLSEQIERSLQEDVK
jgi:hypothetical protein